LAQALETDVAAILELAAMVLRGEKSPQPVNAIGFPLPARATASPRALVDQLVDLLAPEDIAMLGEMGAFLHARRTVGLAQPQNDEK
jgi:hypothetical protein